MAQSSNRASFVRRPGRTIRVSESVVDQPTRAVRVFISYAHDNDEQVERVRAFYTFLREQGIDARLDLPAAERPQDWATWALREIRAARFVLVIASPEYRRRAEGDAPVDKGRGVTYEAMLIREEVYADQQSARGRFLAVVLPGSSVSDIPQWMSPTSATHYLISDYRVGGAETLLRLLTDQPYETVPALGTVPNLRTRDASLLTIANEGTSRALLRRLADRTRRNEAMVQADVRQLLLTGGLGLDESHLSAALPSQTEDRRRIDIAIGNTAIEVHKDLRDRTVLYNAMQSLYTYLAARSQRVGERYVGVLTDGVDWHVYQCLDGSLSEALSMTNDPASQSSGDLLVWLEAILTTGKRIKPSPGEIKQRLGAGSPSYRLDYAELESMYRRHRATASVMVKRGMWRRLLTTAQGTAFADSDSMFVDHTLLVAMAKVIGHALVGVQPNDPSISATDIMSGQRFSKAQIGGVIEPDFFDWLVDVPGGPQFIAPTQCSMYA